MKIKIINNLRLSEITPQFRQIIIKELEFINPKWLENEKMGRWNKEVAKILRFYDKTANNGLWIPRGYMRHLINLCRQHEIEFEIEDERRICPEIEVYFSGKLKDFQQQAVDIMIKKDFGTLCAPTGSGKTVMALAIIAKRAQPTIIIVHTKDLALQWIDRINEFLGIPTKEIGMIGGGQKSVGDKITVALIQSLYKCAGEIYHKIGHLIVDECHRIPSRTFTEAVYEFDSKYMLGLSATPFRRDRLSKLIFWHLGNIYHKIKKSDLIETGNLVKIKAIFRETNFKPFYNPVHEYSKMLSELTSDDLRNNLIISDIAASVKNDTGVCLVLSDRKKHCETLQTMLKFKHHIQADLLTGDLSMEQRKKVIAKLNQGETKVLIATGQLIGEGFDCRALAILFLATPIRFSGRVTQYLGRILRPASGKKIAIVYDYVDVKVDVLRTAAQTRQKIYDN